ncbi:MAG: serpin family protein [Planctomycetaceae bacterium]|nr:serpin family protein [Planctomycetaceae bacterium]
MLNNKLLYAILLLLTASTLTMLALSDTEKKQETVTPAKSVDKNVAESCPEQNTTKTQSENKLENDFLFSFYRTVCGQNGTETSVKNNTVVSPYGASCLGEMLMFGAEGETKQSLQNLFVPSSQATKRTTWFHLPKNKEKELPLVSANGMWIQKGFPIRSAYTVTLQTLFDVNVTESDFTKNAAGECTKINAWIAAATENRITKLFETLDPQSRLVLVNTLNFQGKWAFPFNKSATKTGTFYCTKDKTVEVPLMQNTLRLNYIKNDLYQAVALPYEKNRCSMIIVLPNETTMLDQIERSLNELSITGLTDKMILERVECTLPIFEIESEIDLKSVLTAMGAGIVFDSQKADFSGISSFEGLYVDRMIQKVLIRVDESGTEAVAGTGMNIVPKSANISETAPIIFRADHPFLFLIQDNTNRVPLFIGRYVVPSESSTLRSTTE